MNELDRIENFNKGDLPDGIRLSLKINDIDNPTEILERTKEIMVLISQYAYSKNWPNYEEWLQILPVWFVESMTLKTSEDRDNDENLWHFESWISSMKDRAWVWWSSKVLENGIEINLKMLDLPYVYEQFIYIFYAQGVPLNKISDIDDIYGKTVY